MAEYLEIEQKFEVDEDFKRPDFGGLPGGVMAAAPVRHHLTATYYDTPDGRLMAKKITLRRRTGGTDEGWHLKLPAGQDARRELRAPLGTDCLDVPEALAARVAEVTEGQPLAPIAVLDTERTVVTLTGQDGRVVAEVADDVVTARRLPGSAGAAGAGTMGADAGTMGAGMMGADAGTTDAGTMGTGAGTMGTGAGTMGTGAGTMGAGTAGVGDTGGMVRWREIEVEVPAAAPELQRAAADLLRGAGARPGGHGSKLARLLDT